jgi:hypothetical protein
MPKLYNLYKLTKKKIKSQYGNISAITEVTIQMRLLLENNFHLQNLLNFITTYLPTYRDMTFIARQPFGKHIPVAKNTQATIE